ncbi:MAG: ATP-binding protein [Leptolyngbyaceae cyanobacterium RM1_406_9]|nr:ATP-binding protein [Leptolyngbyaceae cyanobacterium RM1_406_9]
MSSLEELQQQLEQFRAASQNLQLEPLLTRAALQRLGVEYQTELIDELEQAIDDSIGLDEKLIFTGHTGCGKSTLLAELRFRLIETGRYFVVMFSIADTIERSAVDHVNILFSMAVQMLEAAEEQQVKLQPGIQKALYQWLGKHTKTESQAVEAEIEANAEAAVKGGIPLLLEFLAAIKSKLKVNSVVRDEISVEFARKISDLIAQINAIQIYISNATGQQVVVIIDDLDKLDLSITESIFSKNIQPLLDPGFRIVYTIPIATLREVSLRRGIEQRVKQIYSMRVAKFFSKATVRSPDRVPDAACVDLFAEVLDKRLPPELIDPTVKQQMLLKSGGVLRELIRIVDRCCDKCKTDIRGRIRRSQFDKPPVVINQQVLDQVMTDLQIEYAEPLGRNDYKLLKFIYDEFEPEDAENQRFLDLLHGLYMLEYRNAAQWYDLSPIVIDLMRQRGDL